MHLPLRMHPLEDSDRLVPTLIGHIYSPSSQPDYDVLLSTLKPKYILVQSIRKPTLKFNQLALLTSCSPQASDLRTVA